MTCGVTRLACEYPQDVGDARATETTAAGIEKQRAFLVVALLKPCLEGIERPGPQRAGPLFATFTAEGDQSNGIASKIADVEVDELLDTGSGVVEQQQQRPVAATGDRVDGLEESEDFVVVEVLDLWMFEASGSQLANPAAALQMLGSYGGDVAGEGLDGCEPVISGARTTVALGFEGVEEREDDLDVERGVVELIGAAAESVGRVTQEQLERVPVGQHRVPADMPLDDQVFLEEVLDESLEGHNRPACALHDGTSSRARVQCSKRAPACSSSPPLAIRYSRVPSTETWPR